MLNDKTTLKDLSIFSSDGHDIFSLLDRTTTQEGKDALRKIIHQPPATYEALQELQDTIAFWYSHPELWTKIVTNGTLVMLEKFFESAAVAPPKGVWLSIASRLQMIFDKNEYFFTKFSVSHLTEFLKGCQEMTGMLSRTDIPLLLRRELESVSAELQHHLTSAVLNINKNTPYKEVASLSYKARREMKRAILRLIQRYARLDAWQSLGRATSEHGWTFPQLLPDAQVCFEATALHHPLLKQPVSYTIHFDDNKNFLLLTGANMSGKTTFMRAIGASALLAHLGVGVPAKSMRISFLQGVITNMHVEDNILKGESYFFAEVKRMKHTAERIVHDKPHLVLMDELFKGTNVHDAYECTRAVVDGLLQRPKHLMILSTHLYEVAQHFKERKEIQFAYFVTTMSSDNSYHFTYELKEGISNDRIGYRILQKEGVLDLLNNGNA